MLNRIIKFSLENRILILVLAVLLVIAGLYSTAKTEVDVFPDLNAPTVVIMTEAGGMARSTAAPACAACARSLPTASLSSG